MGLGTHVGRLLSLRKLRRKNLRSKESPARANASEVKFLGKMLARVSLWLSVRDFALVKRTETILLRVATALMRKTTSPSSIMDLEIPVVQTWALVLLQERPMLSRFFLVWAPDARMKKMIRKGSS